MEDAIREVASFAGVNGVRVSRRLSSGTVSERWLLETDDGLMVATVDHPLAESLLLDRPFQMDVLKHIFGTGLAPEPIARCAAQKVFLLRYIPGRSLESAHFCQHNTLAELAGVLRQLHTLEVQNFPETNSLLDKINGYASFANAPEIAALQSEAEILLRSGYAGQDVALCHNDVNHGNVIDGNGLSLIDWDYAALGDPYFDLATVIKFHDLNQAAANSFLDAYFGRQNAVDKGRLRINIRLYEIVTKLWKYCTATE